jgi:hypothetical protein
MEEASAVSAGTFKMMVVFLTVSPHEATLHTDSHQNYKCGRRGKEQFKRIMD